MVIFVIAVAVFIPNIKVWARFMSQNNPGLEFDLLALCDVIDCEHNY